MVQAPDMVTMDHHHPDLPEALILLNEMNVSAQHVALLVDNMIKKVRNGELSTDQGLSFLEMKYNMLLSYLINLTFIVLRKCSGERIEGDPCIDRLIEIRTVLEKIRPIDHKLKYQIDKLVKTAVAGGANVADATALKPNPDGLVDSLPQGTSDEDDEDDRATDKDKGGIQEKGRSGVYVPPKLSAVHYNGDESAQDRNKRAQERSRKHTISSSIMQDLRDEYLDVPIEVSQGNRAQQLITKQQQEREEYEETYLTRLPVSKSDKHKRRQLTTLAGLGDEVTDFADRRTTSSNSNSGGVKRKRRQGGAKVKGKNFKRKRYH